MLDGYKTYIAAIAMGLGTVAVALGWISQQQYEIVMGLLASFGLIALRAGVKKSGE